MDSKGWKVAQQIDFGDTQTEQLAVLMQCMRLLWTDVRGNGQAGLKQRAEAFMDEHEGARKEQERQHRSNSMKLNWLLALSAIATIISFIHTLLK
jgi:hypothetical protein